MSVSYCWSFSVLRDESWLSEWRQWQVFLSLCRGKKVLSISALKRITDWRWGTLHYINSHLKASERAGFCTTLRHLQAPWVTAMLWRSFHRVYSKMVQRAAASKFCYDSESRNGWVNSRATAKRSYKWWACCTERTPRGHARKYDTIASQFFLSASKVFA